MMILSTIQGAQAVSSLFLDSSQGWIVLRDSDAADLLYISNPFHSFDLEEDVSLFEVIVFSRQNWPEAQVWILEEGGKGVGHIFSLEALASTQSVLLEDKYLKFGALVALKKLCLGISIISY